MSIDQQAQVIVSVILATGIWLIVTSVWNEVDKHRELKRQRKRLLKIWRRDD